MALTDPQSITVNAVAKSMPRLSNDGMHTIYQMDDQTFTLDIQHFSTAANKKSRVRSLVKFIQRAIVADPLTAVNDYDFVTVSLQIERPEFGFTATQIDQMVAGFKTWLDTTMVGKLYGRQS